MDDTMRAPSEETIARETPQLLSLLKEMKDGLDIVRSKVEMLTRKVKKNELPTADGMSYLEAKHLLLLGYCQSIVYYLLRKAKGLSIEGHPVVRSLVETRLFLEKIRPIDKKLEYQVQKFMRAASGASEQEKPASTDTKKKGESQEEDDPLKYRPNPDWLVRKTGGVSEKNDGGVYRPPRLVPTTMDKDVDNDKMSKEEKQAKRRAKELLRQSERSSYLRDLVVNFEERPEELRDTVGVESRELSDYRSKREAREREEEEIFTRAPITKRDKKLEKYMEKSRYGMRALTDGFFDEVKSLPLEEKDNGNMDSFMPSDRGGQIFKKQKRRH